MAQGDRSPPASAGDMGLIPGPEDSKLQGTGACATTTEARVPRVCVLQQQEPPRGGSPRLHNS